MKNGILIGTLIAILVIAIGGYLFPKQVQTVLGGGTRMINGLSTTATSPSAGQVRTATLLTTGASTLGGTVTITTSNTATSTLIVGCIQTYATSTANPIRLIPSAFSGTTTADGGISNFLMAAQFGTCPH